MGSSAAFPPDDYYALLGVHAGVDGEGLRRAWRRMAVRYHPDRAGDGATTTFQRLSAAYAVLSDPIARAAYDRCRRVGGHAGAGAAGNDAGAGGSRSRAATSAATGSATTSPPPARPAREPAPAIMLARLCGSLSTLLACGAARLDDDDDDDGVITLVLREDEAAQGGMVSISMHVELRCPACAAREGDGAAQVRSAVCARCGGRGTVEELFSAWLAVVPGVAAGELLIPSAELPGMVQPVRFRVGLSRPRG